MSAERLFPFAEYWWFYAGFSLFVIALLALDLGVFHRKPHAISTREALAWSAFWVALALAFNVGFYYYALGRFESDPRVAAAGLEPRALAARVALEYLTGFVVEKALSIDNIFVFVVVLSYFGVPSRFQHRVLYFGILGALVFRAAFIALGALLIQYKAVVVLFGVFLIVTGVRVMRDHHGSVDPEQNPLILLFRRYVPVTPRLHEQRFFVRLDGRLHATPLFVAVLFLELTDIVFAVDSVPAIFAITREPLIVFTSNIFAILGLRNLYFLLRNAIDAFHLLKYGLGVVLVFVGLKMVWLNEAFGGHFPIGWSLGIIVCVIGASMALSLAFPKRGRA